MLRYPQDSKVLKLQTKIKGKLTEAREIRENNLIRSLFGLGLDRDARKLASRLENKDALAPEVSRILHNPALIAGWRHKWTPFIPDKQKYKSEIQANFEDMEKWRKKFENSTARLNIQRIRERLLHEAESGLDPLRECLKRHPMWKLVVKIMWKQGTEILVNVDNEINVRMVKQRIQEREGVDITFLHCFISKQAENDTVTKKRPPSTIALPGSFEKANNLFILLTITLSTRRHNSLQPFAAIGSRMRKDQPYLWLLVPGR
jgi:hypothetical protein